jgi:hypothetical protein
MQDDLHHLNGFILCANVKESSKPRDIPYMLAVTYDKNFSYKMWFYFILFYVGMLTHLQEVVSCFFYSKTINSM